ncbi:MULTISPECIES: hypothetical protein [Paenibacillus]|uniref:hypothetical protein n=1 Tax=Paenibacillus TaxID=44249 RepID=UPI0022B8ACDC|nr:hypothetical protein [Paenibacillus caseinilyticus]MCZ8524035.1 hypothetical protein [Paenibacillus caseinilyticus]
MRKDPKELLTAEEWKALLEQSEEWPWEEEEAGGVGPGDSDIEALRYEVAELRQAVWVLNERLSRLERQENEAAPVQAPARQNPVPLPEPVSGGETSPARVAEWPLTPDAEGLSVEGSAHEPDAPGEGDEVSVAERTADRQEPAVPPEAAEPLEPLPSVDLGRQESAAAASMEEPGDLHRQPSASPQEAPDEPVMLSRVQKYAKKKKRDAERSGRWFS